MRGPETKTSAKERWIRRGIPVAAVLAAAGLVGALASSHLGLRHARTLLDRGEAELVSRRVSAILRVRGRPQPGLASELLSLTKDDGLAYIALISPRGDIIEEAGTRTKPVLQSDLRAGDMVHGAGWVRVFGPPHGPPLGGPHPPQDRFGSDGRPPRGKGPPFELRSKGPPGLRRPVDTPMFVLDVAPHASEALAAEARFTLIVGTAAALILVLGGLGVAWLLAQRERLLHSRAHERRLAALGEMSSVLAHEIRNPLAALKGHAQLLTERLPSEGRDKAKAQRVVTEAVRLENLVEDLLTFVRSQQIHPTPRDPARVLRDAVASVDPDGHRVQVMVDEAPASWTLDSGRVHQALVNLLDNGLAVSDRVEARAYLRRSELAFEIRDHGEGLPPGDPANLFEPFVTGRVKGTGLGLAVVHRVAEAHGGTATAENAEDGGARFSLRLPRA